MELLLSQSTLTDIARMFWFIQLSPEQHIWFWGTAGGVLFFGLGWRFLLVWFFLFIISLHLKRAGTQQF